MKILKIIVVDVLLFLIFSVILSFFPSILCFPLFLLCSFFLYKLNTKLICKPQEDKQDD